MRTITPPDPMTVRMRRRVPRDPLRLEQRTRVFLRIQGWFTGRTVLCPYCVEAVRPSALSCRCGHKIADGFPIWVKP